MTFEELKQNLAGIDTGGLTELEDGYARNEWRSAATGSKFCIVYSVMNEKPVGTPAFCLGGKKEEDAIKEAIDRIASRKGTEAVEGRTADAGAAV